MRQITSALILTLVLGLGAGGVALAQTATTGTDAGTAAGTDTGTGTDAGTATDTTTDTATDTGTAAGTEPADPALSLGEEVQQVGEPYTAETFGDWELRCVRAQDGSDPCQLYQLLKDAEGNSVAEISMLALPEGGEAVAGATIITPLETLLTRQLTLAIDGGKAKRYPFTFCAAIGCVSRVGFTADEVAQFRKGATATLSIVPVAAPDKEVSLAISLKGFTAGFEAVAKTPAAE